MKIDLDELERKATKPVLRAEDEYGTYRNEVVIALIARIAELEKSLDESLVYWLIAAPLDVGRIGQLRELLDKGAVLP